MDETSELRSLAQKCRRLADAIYDGPARENLQSLAAEYEERASVEHATRDDDRALMPWAPQA